MKTPKPAQNILLFCILLTGFFSACHFPRRAEDIKSPLPDTAAFEAAHFGFTEKEYYSKVKDTVAIIGDDLFSLHPFFIPNDRRMYMLQLRSAEAPYKKFDTQLKADMQMLIGKFTALYGNPTRWAAAPEADKLEPRRVIWNCEWIYPNKTIKIGIGRLPDKTRFFMENRFYTAVCEIVNKPLLKIANQQIIYTDLP